MWDLIKWDIALKLEAIGAMLGAWFDKHLVNILAIIVGAWVIRHFCARLVIGLMRHTVRSDLYPSQSDREKRLRTLDSLVGAFFRVGVSIIAFILLIGEINPGYTAALFTSAGLIGAAIGFGAKDIINDFVSGMFIILENQYRVGDIISAGGVSGMVEDITIRTTVLRDLDGSVHHIPNGALGVTTNRTLGFSQLNEDLTVAPKTDLAKLEHTINHLGQEMAAHIDFKSKIIEPPYFERIVSLDGKGITIKIMGRTTPGEQWQVRSELLKRLSHAFQRADIEITSEQ